MIDLYNLLRGHLKANNDIYTFAQAEITEIIKTRNTIKKSLLLQKNKIKAVFSDFIDTNKINNVRYGDPSSVDPFYESIQSRIGNKFFEWSQISGEKGELSYLHNYRIELRKGIFQLDSVAVNLIDRHEEKQFVQLLNRLYTWANSLNNEIRNVEDRISAIKDSKIIRSTDNKTRIILWLTSIGVILAFLTLCLNLA